MSDSELKAQQRKKNDIIHIFNGEKTRGHPLRKEEIEVSICGSCDRTGTTQDVSREKIINNDYFIVDGEIIGKFCGNCARVIRREAEADEE